MKTTFSRISVVVAVVLLAVVFIAMACRILFVELPILQTRAGVASIAAAIQTELAAGNEEIFAFFPMNSSTGWKTIPDERSQVLLEKLQARYRLDISAHGLNPWGEPYRIAYENGRSLAVRVSSECPSNRLFGKRHNLEVAFDTPLASPPEPAELPETIP